jgi:hypothetical protein
MIDQNQAERLAGMANMLRPDWPVPSLVAHLLAHHANRPVRDLAVALAWIAADPATENPGRLAQDGPWWRAATIELPPSARNARRGDPVGVVLARSNGPGGCRHGEPRGSDHCPFCRRHAGIVDDETNRSTALEGK